MIIYVENLIKKEKLTKKLLELINNYSKVAGYEVNIQKPNAFLYTNNAQVEFEIKTTKLFTLAPHKNKILSHKSNKICARSVCGKL